MLRFSYANGTGRSQLCSDDLRSPSATPDRDSMRRPDAARILRNNEDVVVYQR
jgi:hypothetical protein